MLQRAKYFLETFPQSPFLAQAYEVAARACFDVQDYPSGLSYAENSLLLLPENSLLLVAVADIEAREGRNNAAIASCPRRSGRSRAIRSSSHGRAPRLAGTETKAGGHSQFRAGTFRASESA